MTHVATSRARDPGKVTRRARRGVRMLAGPAVLCGFVFVAVTGRGAPAPAATAAVDARLVFLRDCATCHGSGGAGTKRGPTLQGKGAALVDYVLTTGRMPIDDPTDKIVRRRPAYDAGTIGALEAYVTKIAPAGPAIPDVDPAVGDVARGGELYRAQCAACHQSAGQGGALLRREAPALRESTPVQIAEAVRVGPGTMPVFGSTAVSDDELRGLVRYVQALQQPNDRGGEPLWHLGPLPEGAVALVAVGVLIVVLRLMGSSR